MNSELFITNKKKEIKELINSKRLVEAEALMESYDSIFANDIEALSIKSVILIMLNKSDEAEIVLLKGLQKEAYNSELLFNLAYVYESRGEFNKAYDYYLKSKSYSEDKELSTCIDAVLGNLQKYLCNTNTLEIKRCVSIIILTYNKLEYTKQCIDSIKKYTPKDAYEIVIVDNNSTDGTREWLKNQKDIRIIFNDKNLGFPGGCNTGIKAALRDNDILLLNNDTIVTPRWLDNLKTCLYSNDNIGAVGSITNSCSNYQSIKTDYKSTEEMISFAEKVNISNPEKWEQKVRLIGYCMLIKRSVLNEVGLLDEDFFPGNFEDDDLGYRIQLKGYRLMQCNDTFIHHYGSVSFNDNSGAFNRIIAENTARFINKWGFDSVENSYVNLPLIKKIYNGIRSPKVLHIGCGTGATLYRIKYLFKEAEISGVEDNEAVSGIADKFIDIKKALIDEDLNYPENYFDYIILTDKIEYSINAEIALMSLSKYLNKEGKILITIKNSNYFIEIIKSLKGSINAIRKPYRFYNFNEIKELFARINNFKITMERVISEISPESKKIIDYFANISEPQMKLEYMTREYLIICEKI
ncbi:glycosyltransferase [Clostridium polynesiense]|uniref:glycosyltransferase n=1 Tax=Clostridium polynesiense TaxID=1325933 RepID=UPI0009E3C8D8|nr:glycosyltransferase [Clostridium polynesiense]